MDYKLAQTTIDFIANLAKYREWMEKERMEMTDQAFMKKYSIWYSVLKQYMWDVEKEYIPRPCKVILDVALVNTMRLTMTDTAIRNHFKTSTENLTNQCWNRSDHWIPGVAKKREKRTKESINKMIEKKQSRSVIKHSEERVLKTDRWEAPEISEYELSWMKDAIIVWTNHCKSLYDKIL